MLQPLRLGSSGKKCRVKDIPRRILEEIDPDSVLTLPVMDEEAVHGYLKACLKSNSYLIVLDDVWDIFAMYLLHYRYTCSNLNHPFLHQGSGSQILLTSRLQQLNNDRVGLIYYKSTVIMRLLTKEES